MKKIVDETYLRVKEILTAKKDKLGELARLLLEKEVVEEADLKKILQLPTRRAHDEENSQTSPGKDLCGNFGHPSPRDHFSRLEVRLQYPG